MKLEIWKDIKGYEGFYKVSNYGRFKSLERTEEYVVNGVKISRKRKEKILSECKDTAGYCVVVLSNGSFKKTFKCHRIVAETFMPNIYNSPVINHKDGNKANNHVSNLEWSTIRENTNHAYKNNLINHYTRSIKCIEDNIIFNSINDASEHYNTMRQNINAVLNGRQKTTVGKHFEYVNKKEGE